MGSRRPTHWHIEIDRATCVQCAGCVSICPTRALDMHGLDLQCQDPLCIGCDLCVRFCPVVSLALEARPPAASVPEPEPVGRDRTSAPRPADLPR